MASAIPLRPLTCQHGTKFLTSRNKWTQITNYASSPLRFITHLTIPHHHRLHLSFALLSSSSTSPSSFSSAQRSFTSLSTLSDTDDHHPGRLRIPPIIHQNGEVRLVIKGRVQGVFYRNWTIENATQLGLKGWVRNRRDGSVETLLSGNSYAVQEMEQRCRRGSPSAMVTGLEVYPSTDDPGSGFERKPTV